MNLCDLSSIDFGRVEQNPLAGVELLADVVHRNSCRGSVWATTTLAASNKEGELLAEIVHRCTCESLHRVSQPVGSCP